MGMSCCSEAVPPMACLRLMWPEAAAGGGSSVIESTATQRRSCLRKPGSEASALPITFRSAQSEPVSMLTSRFIPR